ncbi:pilus assembly protein PilX [Acidovorax cavernicola]|uniref:Pilus assembly protein PilX n=1 Tax=Acidovorax cavernicola TaxID=1675792 RepID=A0A9X8GVW6_9BURK|nr:pilus assembly protein PilX [Acidovorax cavernicola]
MALVRSVDTSTLLLGNMGFKQDATSAADQAARQAIDWLTANSASLNTDLASNGYYASTQELAADGVTARPPIDVTGRQLAASNNRQLIDWDGNSCQSATTGTYNGCTVTTADAGAINSNNARFVIFRLCSKPGNYATDASISCAKPISGAGANVSKKGEMNYAEQPFAGGTSGPYYRIVVRVLGARNTASFTETIVHF